MRDEQRVQRVRAVFDDWADRGRAEGMAASHEFAASRAFDRLELASFDHYLDVGCGNGYTVRWAAERVGPGGRAVGLDVSERMLERAAALSPPACTFLHAAFPVHDLEAATFDAIFSMEVLYYLPDVARALRTVRDLLVPGGRFACVLDYYGENEASHGWPEELGCELTLLSAEGWREAFERAGLAVTAQERVCYPQPEGEAPSWKQTVGSLLTLGARPRSA